MEAGELDGPAVAGLATEVGRARSRAASPGPAGLLHLFVLSGFAVAQPLYDLLGRSAEFFVAHGTGALELVALAVVLSLLVPAVPCVLVLLASRIHRKLGSAVFLSLVGLLIGLFVLQVLRRAPGLPPAAAVALAVFLGALGALAYRRFHPLRQGMSFLAPAVFLFPLLFLFATPVRSLLLPEGGGEGAGRAVARPAPLVFLILDELPLFSLLGPSGEIDAGMFPHFAALAADSHWFPEATTVATSTSLAVPAILTGASPDPEKKLATAEDHPENLFTLLAGTYDLHVVESQTRLCPRELCSGAQSARRLSGGFRGLLADVAVVYPHVLLPAAWTADLPPIHAAWGGFTTTAAPAAEAAPEERQPAAGPARKRWDAPTLFREFLEGIRLERRPQLFFHHLMLPHVPWKFLPSGKEYGPIGTSLLPHGARGDRWIEDDWAAAQGMQRYLLQLGFVDDLLGQLLAKLRETGLYDEAAIVLVADHGASFRPGDERRQPTATNLGDVANVPLLLKVPGQREAAVSHRPAEVTDILPTLVEVLGIADPPAMDGRSLLGPEEPEGRKRWLLKTERRRAPERVEIPAEALADRSEQVRWKVSHFGHGTPEGVYAAGPRKELHGRAVNTELLSEKDSGATVVLNEPWFYERIDLEGPYLPAHLTGRISSAAGEQPSWDLAVALNGTVEATTRPYRDGLFAAMLPERSFRPGSNRVEVFRVTGEDSGLRLEPLGAAESRAWTLAETSQGAALAGAGGEIYPVDPVLLESRIRRRSTNRNAEITGWFEPPEGRKQRPAHLVLFGGDRFLYAGQAFRRPEFGPGTKDPARGHLGFKLRLPDALLDGAGGHRLFVVWPDRAWEIPWKP